MAMICHRRPSLRHLPACQCLLWLAGVLTAQVCFSGAPAHAVSGIIDSAVVGPITVGAGETLEIVEGGSVTSAGPTVFVESGGTLIISGGSVTGLVSEGFQVSAIQISGGTLIMSGGSVTGYTAVGAWNGTVRITGGSVSGKIGVYCPESSLSISGGSVHGQFYGVYIYGGDVTISGGSITSVETGLHLDGSVTVNMSGGSLSSDALDLHLVYVGTLTLTGCNLARSTDAITGILQDGSVIHHSLQVDFGSIILQNSASGPPQISCTANQTVPAATLLGTPVSFPTPAAISPCSVAVSVVGSARSGSVFPVGTTPVTYTATDVLGNSSSCTFTVTVLPPAADLVLNLAATPVPVKNKQPLTYTLTVRNLGATEVENVVVTDALPAETTFISASASPGVTLSPPAVGTNGTLIGTVARMKADGSPATITVTVLVNTRKTIVTNTATVSSGIPDPYPANNSASLMVPTK